MNVTVGQVRRRRVLPHRWDAPRVAIEQRDHVVVVEGPQNEARSLAVIARVKETIPNKPFKYLNDTHAHFDHSGGVRPWVDEGSDHRDGPDEQAVLRAGMDGAAHARSGTSSPSPRSRHVRDVSAKYVLADGKRQVGIHEIAGSGHADGFLTIISRKRNPGRGRR